jgi:hypothetical protein
MMSVIVTSRTGTKCEILSIEERLDIVNKLEAT